MNDVRYTDDLHEMDSIGARVVATLPPPERLVIPDDGVKVTLTLSRQSVDFFKEIAQANRVPYQRMIRNLVDEYTRAHRTA